MERAHYDLIQKKFLTLHILLFRIQDGGFMKDRQMISAQKGTDFWGISINEASKAVIVEAKEDKSLAITESLLKKIRPSQYMRMNLVQSQTCAGVYLTTYNPDDKKVRIWVWRNPKPLLGEEPLWVL